MYAVLILFRQNYLPLMLANFYNCTNGSLCRDSAPPIKLLEFETVINTAPLRPLYASRLFKENVSTSY